VRERRAEFDGIEIDSHPIRRYPHAPLAAHVLGTLGAAAGPGQAGRQDQSRERCAHRCRCERDERAAVREPAAPIHPVPDSPSGLKDL